MMYAVPVVADTGPLDAMLSELSAALTAEAKPTLAGAVNAQSLSVVAKPWMTCIQRINYLSSLLHLPGLM